MDDESSILRIDLLDRIDGLRHGFTTRRAGAGRLDADSLRDRLGLTGHAAIRLRQVHGDRVETVREAAGAGRERTADAAVTDRPRVLLAIRTADCVPILAADPVRRAVGAAHAGWRGISLGLPAALVAVLSGELGCRPERLRIGLGPSIGPCCYTVGPEVRNTFAARGRDVDGGDFAAAPNGGLRLDLKGAVVRQLRAGGVPAASIETIDLCTRCRGDLFFSRRRDGAGPDRLHAFIALD